MAEEQPKKLTGWFLTAALAASLSLNVAQLGGDARAAYASIHEVHWEKCFPSDDAAVVSIRAKLLGALKNEVAPKVEKDPADVRVLPGSYMTALFGNDTPGQITPTCFGADLDFPSTTVLD